jgi:hypothetical protein
MRRCSRLGLMLVVAGLTLASAQGTGSVEGLVLDGDGKPLPDATVFVGTIANSPRAQTDADGKFTLEDIPVGTVGLNAFKESDGYPYNMFSFFLMPGEQLPQFDLAARQTVKGVVVRLGAKAAYLKLLVTTDEGVPLNAELSFSRPDLGKYGDYQRSAQANDLILVPPVPFRLTVTEKGYQPWHYGGDEWQAPRGLVQLKSGETKVMTVKLKKLE